MCSLFIFVLLPARSETATAADSAIRCRCGVPFSAAPFQHAFWTALSFAPLPQRQQNPQFGTVVECHFPPHPFSMPSGRHCRSPLYRNGSKFRNSVPLWSVIFRRPRSACLLDGIVVRPFAATAAKPVIRCRCGKPAPASFCLRSFPRWKVPVEMAFCHYLLIFVISGSASEVALGDPAPVSCGEGAG